MFVIFVNTIFLASDTYDQPQFWTDVLKIGNTVFTVIFTIEMCIKLFGFGVRGYLADPYNIFDGIIVLISIAELSMNSSKSEFQVFRALRLTRVFRIVKAWKNLRLLLETVGKSFQVISNLGMLTFIFIFLGALLGKTLFAKDN